MVVVADHGSIEAVKKAGKTGRGKYFLHSVCGVSGTGIA